ncbi:MAG: hypothetical protein KKD66_18740, partial [Proteobacteria bacterium]|nr:hypothetical protein [Pseudomonadota bacterium]MBU2451869.1 hypothetical protein [Pseudomonadota bacterium]
MFGNQPGFKYYLLLLDTLIISVSIVLAGKEIGVFPPLYIVIVSLLMLLFNDLYKRNIVYTRYRQTILLIKSMAISSLVSLVIMAILQYGFFIENGRFYLFKYFIFSIFVLIIARVLFVHKIMNFLSAKGYFNTNILIVGGDKAGVFVADTIG